MAYGHAERNLAAIRRLEAETKELAGGLPQSGSGQSRWLQQTAKASSQRPDAPAPGVVPGHVHDHGVRDGTVMIRGDVTR
jgi:hypothetical protein